MIRTGGCNSTHLLLTNYIMAKHKVVFRVAQGIAPADVEKLHNAIKTRLPNDVTPPTEKDFIWFNPSNGMELPSKQTQKKPIEINYLQDNLDRVSSIKAGIDYLLNCLKMADLSAAQHGDRKKLYEDCKHIILLKSKQTAMRLSALEPINDAEKLKQARALISQFTHFCNVSLIPILATKEANFLPNDKLSLANLKKTQQLLDRAEECALAANPREIVCTISQCEAGGFAVDIATPIKSFISKTASGQSKNLLVNYKGADALSTPVQLMLKNLEITVNSHPEQLYVASSRADNVHGRRNSFETGNLLLDNDGQEVFFSEVTRIGHISSRANESEGVTDKQRKINAITNLEQSILHEVEKAVAQSPNNKTPEIFVHYSTLISPLAVVPDSILPDKRLDDDKEFAVDVLKKRYRNKDVIINGEKYNVTVNIFSVNNAVNERLGQFIPTYAGNVATEYQRLVNTARKFVGQDQILSQLLDELENVLNYGMYEITKSRHYNRELHIAALGRVICARLKWPSIGGCFSNKDREAMRNIYRKSMEEYIAKYNEVPKLADAFDLKSDPAKQARRQNFIDINTRRYLSGDEQHLAKKSAEGARGTKTPYYYLPKDMQQAIKAKSGVAEILKHSEALAAMNDLHKLKFPKEELLPDYLAAIREEQHYFRSLDQKELRENPSLILGQASPTIEQLIFAQEARSRSGSLSTENSNTSIQMFNGNDSLTTFGDEQVMSSANAETNAAIKKTLKKIKFDIYTELKSGKYDNYLTGEVFIAGDTKQIQLVPKTIMEVFNLLDKLNTKLEKQHPIEVSDFQKLIQLAGVLKDKGNSFSFVRKPVTESLYINMSSRLFALTRLMTVNEQSVVLSQRQLSACAA